MPCAIQPGTRQVFELWIEIREDGYIGIALFIEKERRRTQRVLTIANRINSVAGNMS